MKDIKQYITENIKNRKEFVIIKPGFLQYRNEIVKKLQEEGFIIRSEICRILSKKDARLLYSPHKQEKYFNKLIDYMISDESIGFLLTNYKGKDLKAVKEEIRKKYGKDELRNCLHSSDEKRVNRESQIYFRNNEYI